MKHTPLVLASCLILICSGLSWAADAMPVKCNRPLSAAVDIQKYITMDGELDIAALQADGYDPPLLPSDFYLLRHALAGESELEDISMPTLSSDPDDVYWRHDIPSFYPGTNGSIYAMAAYQGSLIVAGNFTIAGGKPARNIAAWDGHEWTALGAGVNRFVECLAVYDGKLIAGGFFDSAGGAPIVSLAAWDGTTWSAFEGPLGRVASLSLYGDDLIVGGWFDSAGGVAAKHIARWDGTSWSALGAGLNGIPLSYANYHGKLVAGGYFDSAGSVRAVGIASWDGSSWSPLGPELSPGSDGGGWFYGVIADDLIEYEDKLIVGGLFTGAEGVTSHGAIAWDGENWIAMDAGVNRVSAYEIYDDVLYMSGSDWSECYCLSAMKRWDGSEWIDLEVEPSCVVYSFQIYDGLLYAGGVFSRVDSIQCGAVASWDGIQWSVLGEGVTGIISALGSYGDNLIAGGPFRSTSSAPANRVAIWNKAKWSALGSGLPVIIDWTCICPASWCPCNCPAINPASLTFGAYGDLLITGGVFDSAGSEEAHSIAGWNGSFWTSLDSGVGEVDYYTPGAVTALARYGGQLIAAGSFPSAGDVEARNIAAWDGTSWAPLGNGLNRGVSALASYDGKLIAAGYFDSAGAVAAPGLAAWDGTQWSAFAPGADRWIDRLSVYQGRLIAAGRFTTAGEVPAHHVAAWDGTTWSALGDGIDGDVLAFAVFDGQLIAGGKFTTAGAIAANNIAAWDGSSWSTLGSGTDGRVRALLVYDHELAVGGDFFAAGGMPSPYLAEWTKRGTLEVALDVKPGSCPNPINGNSAHGKGKAVLPVAIMGTDQLDVYDIDPASVTLNGVPVVRWGYEDVGAPGEASDEDCDCSEAGPDGYEDLTLKFYSAEVVATLNASLLKSGTGSFDHETYLIEVDGALTDGSEFTGSDCVLLVGKGAAKEASETAVDRGLELIGNYPNPFNPSTRISFYLPMAVQVRLEVFNILGRRVTTLLDARMEAGIHSVTWNAEAATSGVYYYRVQAGRNTSVGKMLLVK